MASVEEVTQTDSLSPNKDKKNTVFQTKQGWLFITQGPDSRGQPFGEDICIVAVSAARFVLFFVSLCSLCTASTQEEILGFLLSEILQIQWWCVFRTYIILKLNEQTKELN